MPRLVKIILRVVLGLIVLYVALCAIGAVLAMRIPRLPLKGSPASAGLSYTDVSFPSRNSNFTLEGWFIHGAGNKTIIIVHGGFQNRLDDNVDTLDLTKSLVADGYNVLLFDLRGRGESQGTGLNILTNEDDIGGAVDYLNSRGITEDDAGIIGFCSGAASTAIFTSQENVGAVVLDGCFASVETMVNRQASERHIPTFLVDSFIPGLEITVKLFFGAVPQDPINVVPEINCPVFFIHEQDDNLTTTQETDELFAAAKNPADEFWEIPGALHSEGYKADPVDYVNKVNAFFSVELK
ncbi:MAG: alpha/beta hydrolase [Dehalococcoidales bacterium]